MFLDTSGLMSLFDVRDRRHLDARKFYDAARERVTRNYILAEFVALANARGAHSSDSPAFVAALLDNPEIAVIWVDEFIHQAAVAFLQLRLDKAWSLCDAVSFLLMQQHGLMEALTTDQHFEQAGFVCLLKP